MGVNYNEPDYMNRSARRAEAVRTGSVSRRGLARSGYNARMRRILAILLCLIVALEGMAGARAAAPCCPMEFVSGETSAAEAIGATSDCCNDAETTAWTGKPCKTDSVCNAAGVCTLSSMGAGFPAARQADLLAAVLTPLFSLDRFEVWRPPIS